MQENIPSLVVGIDDLGLNPNLFRVLDPNECALIGSMLHKVLANEPQRQMRTVWRSIGL